MYARTMLHLRMLKTHALYRTLEGNSYKSHNVNLTLACFRSAFTHRLKWRPSLWLVANPSPKHPFRSCLIKECRTRWHEFAVCLRFLSFRSRRTTLHYFSLVSCATFAWLSVHECVSDLMNNDVLPDKVIACPCSRYSVDSDSWWWLF